MVMTIVEAKVARENWPALKEAYEAGTERPPSQLVETFLVHESPESTLWRIVGLWPSREALEEMRQSTGTPGAVLMFRAAGAEPTLSVFDVAAHAAGESWRREEEFAWH
jgi:hypothetical protein